MTLAEFIATLIDAAAAQPAVKMIVHGDVFRLNECPSAKYGVFAWTQGEHSANVNSGVMSLRFTLFYVDRLTMPEVSSSPYNWDNVAFVQSEAIQVLDNIIRSIANRDDLNVTVDSDYTFTTFTQRFEDECAGAFASVRFLVPVDTPCGEASVLKDIITY